MGLLLLISGLSYIETAIKKTQFSYPAVDVRGILAYVAERI